MRATPLPAAPRLRRRCTGAVVVALAVVAAACSGSATHGQSDAPSTTRAHAATTAPPPGSLPATTWSRVSDPSLDLGGGASSTIAALVAPTTPSSQWLAAGTQTAAGGATTATVWSSPDALHWTAAPLAGPGPSQARAATAWSGGDVIVGATGTGGGEQAAVWVSTGPGRPYTRVNDPGVFGSNPVPTGSGGNGSGAVMDHVAAGALGIFASGTISGQTALWYSSNGTRWTRLTGAEKVVDASTEAVVNALVVAQNGVWLAGTIANGTATDAAMWTSTDGIHWQQVTSAQRSFHGDGDHVIKGLATFGTGFVAVGAVRTGSAWMPASWISPDGASWSQPSESFPMATRGAPDNTGSQVVAVGSQSGTSSLTAVGGSPSAPRVWTSTDGLSWTELGLPPAASQAGGWRLGLVATSGTVTVVADDTVGAPRLLTDSAGTWTEVTADPAAFGPPAAQVEPSALLVDGPTAYLAVNLRLPGQTLGSASWSAAVLSTTNGRNWSVDVSGGPFAGQQIRALLAAPTGLMAFGGTASAATPAASVWSSPDGSTWTPVPTATPNTFTSPGQGELAQGAARLGTSLVAVGRGPGGPAGAPTGPDDQAVAWLTSGGAPWEEAGSLDAAAGLGIEDPTGACSGPQTVVAVGSGTAGSPGWQALAWSSTNGRTWQASFVTPPATPGEEESMNGCLTTGSGFLAYGGSGGSGAEVDPALWSASAGGGWTRQTVTAFSGTGAGALTGLAIRGTSWLAVSGSSSAGSPAPATPTAASAGSTVGVWRSADAGTGWQRVNTMAEPWTGQLDASVQQVGWLNTTALVVGTVDGRLAVWTGITS